MKAIVLAAGRGNRLSPYTDHCPKAMVELWGKPLLHHQLEVLNRAGIRDVVVVSGYRGDQILHSTIGFRRIDNVRWQETNMVASLYCAASELSGDVIVAYADIIYESTVVDALKASTADVSVVVDTGFLSYWKARFDDPLSDLESLQLDQDQCITKIGDRVADMSNINAQYIGLLKFSPDGSARLRHLLDELRRDASFDRMFMTDLLRRMINLGCPVKAVPHWHGWLEIDTVADLELAQTLLSDGSTEQFIDPGKM